MRYQFQSEHGQFSFKPRIFTEAIKILIMVNVGIFILHSLARKVVDLALIFGLSSDTVWPLIWQPFTYMFIHGNLWHVLINMFVLWMFGSELEKIWGKKEFLKYYFTTGVGSGLIWLLFNIGSPHTILIGASGAVYGILLAFGLMFPNRTVYIYFLFPVKVKWLVIFLGAMAFVSSLGPGSNISHLTHLSGMIIGYIYMKSDWQIKKMRFSVHKKITEFKTQSQERKSEKKSQYKSEIDQLLDKINRVGYDGLTEEERNRLYTASRRLSREQGGRD
ncbi:MAG: rhomboid family intramembrane serine protease [Candidatus Marinimicrobia bacterium]|nr:rhomboid family intramembrane serine protease [Candidatus Neomarinimicrobiota bacterium]